MLNNTLTRSDIDAPKKPAPVAPAPVAPSRNFRRERRLRHDAARNPTPSLGCFGCRELTLCGGLQLAAPLFSCLDHCCGQPDSCDTVCRNHPNFVDRVREVQGFDLRTVPRAPRHDISPLPSVVPVIYHGSRRHNRFDATPMVALSLYQLFLRTGKPRFGSRQELCDYFRVSPDTAIMLTGTNTDQAIERWWGLESGRREAIRALRELDVVLATTPNFSLFTDQPRWDDLHAMKRIGIVWQEFVEGGVPAALHVNARTPTDWTRWTEFVCSRPEVTHLAYEFATGSGWGDRSVWHAERLAQLALTTRRPLHLVVRGGTEIMPLLRSAFSSITLLETSAFMKTMKRQRAFIVSGGTLTWDPAPTAADEQLDKLLAGNVHTVVDFFCETIFRGTTTA